MACISKALIIGGSIAGLTAAIALARRGVKCDVVEIGDSHLGASLTLAGRAAMALVELGVYDQVRATGRPFLPDTTAASQSDSAGNLLSPGPSRPTYEGYVDPIAVYRPAFVDTLETIATDLGVTIRKNMTTKSIEDEGDRVSVVFQDDTTGQYDLVIGADGIRSKTRTAFFPDAPSPTYAGQWSIRWMAPGPAVEPEGWYNSSVGRMAFYHMPVQGITYVPAVIDIPEPRRLSNEEIRERYTQLFDSFTAPAIVELRSRLTPESDVIAKAFDWILVPDTWVKGRVLLIGDAAHATTAHMGMGAGMAVEDSAVLGQCIETASSLSEALETFMRRRYERVKMVVETSVKLCELEQKNAPKSENIALLTKAFGALGQPY
ncbi:MAG: FAD-dependent monooxygenase [bacterium]|nr:FAD-dependent monooxygenase [bacterium]